MLWHSPTRALVLHIIVSVLSAMRVALHHRLTHVINHVASIQRVEIIPTRIVNLLLMFHLAFLVTLLQRHPATAIAAMLGLDEHVMHSLKSEQTYNYNIITYVLRLRIYTLQNHKTAQPNLL